MTRFLFGEADPRPLAAMRIGLAVVLFVETVLRAPYVVEAYSTAGRVLPAFGPAVGFAPWLAVALHGLLLASLVAVGLGLLTRVSLVASFVLLGAFSLLDFPGTLTKYTAIALHLLALLAAARPHAVWSLDARWSPAEEPPSTVPGWPRRLMQVLVCHVYLGAAITKMRMKDFAIGDVLGFSLIDDRWAGGWLGTGVSGWLAVHPRLLVLASFATLAFEIAFPLLVWFERTRRPMLVAAVLFHLALACTLSLSIFTPLMLVALLAFVEPGDLPHPCADEPRGTTPPESARGLALGVVVWTLLLASGAGVSYVVHRMADPYGVLAGGTHEAGSLRRIPPETARRMLAGELAPAATLVHRIDLGHRVANFQTFGDDERFRSGEIVHVLIRFQQDHPEVAARAVLLDPDGNEAEPVDRVVANQQTHLHLGFQLTDDHPRGEYTIRIDLDGEVVHEPTFVLE